MFNPANNNEGQRSTGTRRSVLRTVGAVGSLSMLPFAGVATAEHASTVDETLDTSSDTLQEVLVVFDENEDVDRLRHLTLGEGYYKFRVLPIGYTELTGTQITTVADWPEVRYVQANAELEYLNDDARSTTGADTVQSELGYTGESVHAAVVDSGVDGDHPDLDANLVANYRFVNPLSGSEDTTWVRAGDVDTDDNGHGTHTSGTVAGTGAKSDGTFRGMAPEADLTVYSSGATLFILKPVAAYDHIIARKQAGETDIQVVSNSWGSASGNDFNPDDAVNVATWRAFGSDILSVFSAGNAGEDCETFAGVIDCEPTFNMLNDYAKAPHVLGVAATDDEKHLTDFSSRGRRPSYDGVTNYDRKKALDNLREYHGPRKNAKEVESGSFSGTVGPTGTGSSYEVWEAPADAGYVEATLSWTPSDEDIDFYLYEGSRDGEIVASGASLNHPEDLEGRIDGGTTYYFEVRPFASVVADYSIEFTAYQGDSRDVHPVGIYRNGVGATGLAVMSTMAPTDPLQSINPDDRPYYARISGTSMSCPVVSGTATLLIDAYQQNNAGSPDPIDVLNTIEAEAEDVHESYNPWNIGAGFVDALDAVRRAEDGSWASFGEVKLTDA